MSVAAVMTGSLEADAAAFEAAIRVSPADDTPRIVYADWLEEHGDPGRAEFIRLQCEVAVMETGPDARRLDRGGAYRRRRDALRKRCFALMWGKGKDRPGLRWLPPLRSFVPAAPRAMADWAGLAPRLRRVSPSSTPQDDAVAIGFRRGFPAVVSLASAVLLGPRCDHCMGLGWTIVDDLELGVYDQCEACPACRSEQVVTAGGVARELAKAVAVERVHLIDRRPRLVEGGERAGQWVWWPGGSSGLADTVPLAVYDRLPPDEPPPGCGPSDTRFRSYPTYERAMTVLVEAATGHVQSLAGGGGPGSGVDATAKPGINTS